MDTRFGAVLFVVIVLAVAVGVAAAQSQPKVARPAAPHPAATPMVAINTAPVVQIVPRPSSSNALPSCNLTAQSTAIVYCPYRMDTTVGGTILWVNWDKEPHTIIADNGSFQSSVLSPANPRGPSATSRDQIYLHKFTRPGIYTYSDYLHPDMHGVVVVRR